MGSSCYSTVGSMSEPEVLGLIPSLATYLFLLPLIQEGQFLVTGESMCT